MEGTDKSGNRKKWYVDRKEITQAEANSRAPVVSLGIHLDDALYGERMHQACPAKGIENQGVALHYRQEVLGQ